MKFLTPKLFFALFTFYLSAAAQSQTCDGAFRDSGLASLDSIKVNTAKACFASGSSMVYINKPSNRRPLSDADLKTILGENGLNMNYEVSNSPAVNCHAFSCQMARIPNFPKNAWIDAKDLVAILKEFFTPTIRTYTVRTLQELENDPLIHEGDLVLMLDSAKVLQHSGIIQRVQVGAFFENWVLSKLDEGPTVLVPLSNLAKYYPIETALIRRRK